MAEKLKVLILNGSPRTEGNTTIAIHEMEHVFEENGVEYETIQVGKISRLQTVWLLQVLSFMHLQMRR